MRRSTAAAVGTLTGAALIVGVRLSVEPPAAPIAAPVAELADSTPPPSSGAKKPAGSSAKPKPKPRTGLKDGVFKGGAASNPYGSIQVSIKVENGEITAAQATYPTTGDSARINPPAIAALKQETLKAIKADDVAAVSGATYTSGSYKESLQAALDRAKA